MAGRFLTIVGGFVHQAAFLLLQRTPVRGKGSKWLKPFFFFPPEGQLAHQSKGDKRNMGPGLWWQGDGRGGS